MIFLPGAQGPQQTGHWLALSLKPREEKIAAVIWRTPSLASTLG